MNHDDWQILFVFVCSFLVLSVLFNYLMLFLPKTEESFFTLAVLDDEGMTDSYYPDDDLLVNNYIENNWTLYLHNNMGEAKYVALKVKFPNFITSEPNSSTGDPSIAPVLYEIQRVVENSETWLVPFSWSIEELNTFGNYVSIEQLLINGDIRETKILSRNDDSFRFILELWVYDENLKDFSFSWKYGDVLVCSWNQIWFNTNSTVR